MLVSVLVLEDFVQRVGDDRNHFVALRDSIVSSMGILSQKLDGPRNLPLRSVQPDRGPPCRFASIRCRCSAPAFCSRTGEAGSRRRVSYTARRGANISHCFR